MSWLCESTLNYWLLFTWYVEIGFNCITQTVENRLSLYTTNLSVSDVQFKRVPVEMICTGSTYHQQQPYVVGQVDISSNMDWSDVYKVVRDLCESYFSQIDRGLHSKKISRLDPENSSEDSHSSLGLTKDSIHSVEIGNVPFVIDI